MEHEPIDGQHLKVLRQVIYHQTEQYINSGKVDGRLIVLDPIVKRKDLPRPPSALKQKEPEETLNITEEYRDKVLRGGTIFQANHGDINSALTIAYQLTAYFSSKVALLMPTR